jgi:hypothetical protein
MIVKRGLGIVQAAWGSLAAGARDEQLVTKAISAPTRRSGPSPKVGELSGSAVTFRFIGALAYTPFEISCRQEPSKNHGA